MGNFVIAKQGIFLFIEIKKIWAKRIIKITRNSDSQLEKVFVAPMKCMDSEFCLLKEPSEGSTARCGGKQKRGPNSKPNVAHTTRLHSRPTAAPLFACTLPLVETFKPPRHTLLLSQPPLFTGTIDIRQRLYRLESLDSTRSSLMHQCACVRVSEMSPRSVRCRGKTLDVVFLFLNLHSPRDPFLFGAFYLCSSEKEKAIYCRCTGVRVWRIYLFSLVSPDREERRIGSVPAVHRSVKRWAQNSATLSSTASWHNYNPSQRFRQKANSLHITNVINSKANTETSSPFNFLETISIRTNAGKGFPLFWFWYEKKYILLNSYSFTKNNMKVFIPNAQKQTTQQYIYMKHNLI